MHKRHFYYPKGLQKVFILLLYSLSLCLSSFVTRDFIYYIFQPKIGLRKIGPRKNGNATTLCNGECVQQYNVLPPVSVCVGCRVMQ